MVGNKNVEHHLDKNDALNSRFILVLKICRGGMLP